jgi:hypothetical protein
MDAPQRLMYLQQVLALRTQYRVIVAAAVQEGRPSLGRTRLDHGQEDRSDLLDVDCHGNSRRTNASMNQCDVLVPDFSLVAKALARRGHSRR